ncbi:hypothetical protein CN984_12070 [Bacillus cereus]|uniref:Uncharacterized protein n=1 Tax=Bacillus cereus TaxID=1396 RepID=A0A2A7FNS7_BACCE|nr:hypothetical protein CON44_18025 [Bacillus cereus]PGA05671.1 hypothetical protein COL71_26105 [Bacillus mycoides]PGO29176.1 hypothetical protein CN984_12070 [Bacillus cereus]
MKIYGLKDVAQMLFFSTKTGEVVSIHGYQKAIQDKVDKLIVKRDSVKHKRLRRRYNNHINNILGREGN